MEELHQLKLHHPGLQWKKLFTSSRDRLAVFLDTASKAMGDFHHKLIVLRVDERLTIAIYISQKVDASRDCRVDNKVRLFTFPRGRANEAVSRLSLPTNVNNHVYCNDKVFQLFEKEKSDSWVYIGKDIPSDTPFENTNPEVFGARQRQTTVKEVSTLGLRASIALEKFSLDLQRHVGMVHSSDLLGAEIYVISNRDLSSMRNLDLWMEYFDTQKALPPFQQNARACVSSSLGGVIWETEPEYVARFVPRQDFTVLLRIDRQQDYLALFSWLHDRGEPELLFRSYKYLLSSFGQDEFVINDPTIILGAMVNFLRRCPFLAPAFTQLDWDSLPDNYRNILECRAEDLLRALILSANEADHLTLKPLRQALLNCQMLSMDIFARLIELLALTVRSPLLALDILRSGFEREAERLLPENQATARYFICSLTGVAIDHVKEAADEDKRDRPDLLTLKRLSDSEDGWPQVWANFPIDAKDGTPETSAHVRLTAVTSPDTSLSTRQWSVDGIVTKSAPGQAEIKCFHPLPPYVEDCSWMLLHCGQFATTKAMFRSVLELSTNRNNVCSISGLIMGGFKFSSEQLDATDRTFEPRNGLDEAENLAVQTAGQYPLTCVWGPPGTRKTQTIVEMVKYLQIGHEKYRILVTAPMHSAVDNMMRKYVSDVVAWPAIRVSTEVSKVSDDLRKYTCDAMAEQEVYDSSSAVTESRQMIEAAQLVFTTCREAGLGLLRGQLFEIVIIDGASQQTEPASLVPLSKGCRKAILVGDHVQLRPAVGQLAASVNYDVSLFERLWKMDGSKQIQKAMLDTQYRMHEDLCRFSSEQFYEAKLRTGIEDKKRPMFPSAFLWPKDRRMVFVECASPEDMAMRSKRNIGQAQLCRQVCELLSKRSTSVSRPEDASNSESQVPTIVVLTPYKRQVELLNQLLSAYKLVEVSTIDGFQGREADIVVFVTVRCNQGCVTGFLGDMRSLNVAMTRAKTGVIVIGNRSTLTMGKVDDESVDAWKELISGLSTDNVEFEATNDQNLW